MKKINVLVILFLISTASVFAQVKIYPMAVYIDPILRSGEMTVSNPADIEKEIEVSLRYGYPTCDSLGRVYTRFNDTISAKEYSLVPYVTIFPKRIIVPAKGEQKIRFMLKNVQNLPDNVYWARIITSSVEAVKQLDTTTAKDKISVGVNIKIEMATAIVYQKGKVHTEINMPALTTKADSANVNLMVNFERGGNSPAFGTCYLTVKDEKGSKIVEQKDLFSIYLNTTKSFPIEKSKLKPGNYKAELKYTNEQDATPEQYRLDFKPFTKSFDFTIE
jgi:P pilus assembly chaperone PapD